MDKKEWAGYKRGKRLNAASGEKTIYSGSFTDSKTGQPKSCVLCFAKKDGGNEALTTLRREADILRNLSGCEYVIEVIDLIQNWGGPGGPLCLVLEMVEPIGYDLFEVFVQHSRSCRPVPLAQVRHYTYQLVCALRHLGKCGTVHRDVKPENVLVDKNQKIKLIDFGFAAQHPDSTFTLPDDKRPQYAAPELRHTGNGDGRADLWGVGCVLYFLCVGCQMIGSAVKNWERQGSFHSHLEQMGVDKEAIDPIMGLLRQEAAERWTLDQLEAWATAGVEEEGLRKTCSDGGGHTQSLRRFPFRDTVPAVIGARLPESWKFNGETIKKLGLMERGVLVLLVVRNSGRWVKCYPYASGSGPGIAAYRDVFTGNVTTELPPEGAAMEVVAGPGPATKLSSEDWVYFGVQEPIAKEDARAQMQFISDKLGISPSKDADDNSLTLARSGRREGLIHDFPEFDGFEFPPHCINAVLGPSSFAKEGQNALNLRSNFGINLAGIAHADDTVTWWPGGGEAAGGLVQPGDYGLIIRLPRWTTETDFVSAPTVSLDVIERLLDIEKFREQLKLSGEEPWEQWDGNSKKLAQQATTVPPKKGEGLEEHINGTQKACCAIS